MLDTPKKIPYVDLASQHHEIKSLLLDDINKVFDHGQFILGPEVEKCEKKLATLCQTKHVIGVNSGTDALVLSLKALNVGPGDEVITVSNSYIATVTAIRLVGAIPIFVDVNDQYLMDPTLIEKKITAKTKAICPVHLTGCPCDMDSILLVAQEYNLSIIEDCSQAILSTYKSKPVGSFGNIGCFSCHPLKNLNACGDAGFICTNDEQLAQSLRLHRNIGHQTRDVITQWGQNSRLDSIQATIIHRKLDYLADWTSKRQYLASIYKTNLEKIPDVRCQPTHAHQNHVYHTFIIQVKKRDQLKAFLESKGIGTAIHYPIPAHLQPIYKEDPFCHPYSLPKTELQSKHILSLPIYHHLKE